MRILVRLHKSIASPAQSYEDIGRTTQVYCLDITHKNLQHHHLNYMRIYVGLDITHKYIVLILLISLMSWYYSQYWRMNPDAIISALPLLVRETFSAIPILSRKCLKFITNRGLPQICNILISTYVMELMTMTSVK